MLVQQCTVQRPVPQRRNYALNEMLKELPFFCRTAEGKIVCPHKEAKK